MAIRSLQGCRFRLSPQRRKGRSGTRRQTGRQTRNSGSSLRPLRSSAASASLASPASLKRQNHCTSQKVPFVLSLSKHHDAHHGADTSTSSVRTRIGLFAHTQHERSAGLNCSAVKSCVLGAAAITPSAPGAAQSAPAPAPVPCRPTHCARSTSRATTALRTRRR